MRLILGGAFQGKLDYVRKTYACQEERIGDETYETLEELFQKPVWNHFHLIILRLLKENMPIEPVVQKAKQREIVITDEVGSGIVPVLKAERKYRESVGRACCELAREAEEVVRIVYGLPVLLKEVEE